MPNKTVFPLVINETKILFYSKSFVFSKFILILIYFSIRIYLTAGANMKSGNVFRSNPVIEMFTTEFQIVVSFSTFLSCFILHGVGEGGRGVTAHLIVISILAFYFKIMSKLWITHDFNNQYINIITEAYLVKMKQS